MLIDQFIEFEVCFLLEGVAGPLVVYVLLKLVIFMTKQKSSTKIFE